MEKQIVEQYKARYESILKGFYPAKNSTGFPERNLSVNYAAAYEKVCPENVIVWYEFQFGENNRKHIDCIIIDKANRCILFVESKRFSNLPKKINEVLDDIDRINSLPGELQREETLLLEKGHPEKVRISNFSGYDCYGVILADVWLETDEKKNVYESFLKEVFPRGYSQSEDVFKLVKPDYFTVSFENSVDIASEAIRDTYKLLGLEWQIK